MMDGLTAASADGLPPLGEPIVEDPFWRYLAGAAREGVAHLRVWLTVGPEPGYLAVVTEAGEGMETLDLVRIGADGEPHWTRVWPTSADNPRHTGLELWMASYGHQMVSNPASWFDSRKEKDDRWS